MASSSDPYNQEVEAIRRQRRKGPNFLLMLPLIYAPVLPLIRIALKNKPVLRDRLFGVVLAGAFAHGAYLVLSCCRCCKAVVPADGSLIVEPNIIELHILPEKNKKKK